MNVAIVGLGLIGGSLAKAFRQNTSNTLLGYNRSKNVVEKAMSEGIIDAELTAENLGSCSIKGLHNNRYLRSKADSVRPL